jgi:hypothetical protein
MATQMNLPTAAAATWIFFIKKQQQQMYGLNCNTAASFIARITTAGSVAAQ